MTFLRRFLFILVLCSYVKSSAQDAETDSLRALLQTGLEDTNRVNNLLELSRNLSRSSPLEAIQLGNDAKELAEKLNFRKGIAYSLKYIGIGYYYLDKYPETINYWKQSLETFESLNDSVGVANILNNIGSVYNNIGDDAKALELYLKSLEISEKINDSLRLLSAMTNIGLIYSKKSSTFEKARQYCLNALDLSEKLGNQDGIGTASVNLGELYFEKGDYPMALAFYEQSLEAFKKSKTGNVPYTLSNIGKVYAKERKYNEAITYQKQAYSMAEKLDAKLDMAKILLSLADTYEQMGDIRNALDYFMHAHAIAEEIRATYELKDAYRGLALSYAQIGDFKNAFKYQDLVTSVMDTIYSENAQRQISLLQIQYETEAMERENVILKRDVELKESRNQQQRLIIYLFILGFFFITIFIILFIRAYNHKRKTNLELEKKNVLITEQKKEIMSSIEYARKIQNAMLTPGDFISSLLPERFILFRPRDIVSGDFYWMTTKNDKIICVVADCTGHGVPGAFMSMLGIALLNEIVSKNDDLSANEILDELRIMVIKSLRQTGREGEILDGIDIILMILDLQQQKAEFAGAHNSLFLLRDGGIVEYKADQMPIGIQTTINVPFTKQIIELKKGDVLYASTDGFIDQFGGPKGKRFMMKNFKNLLSEIYNKSMQDQLALLNKTLDEWMSDTSQIDDILVMGIRI